MMKKNFWQIIAKYKLFVILGGIILLFLVLKLTSKKNINNNGTTSYSVVRTVTKTATNEVNNNLAVTNGAVVSPTQGVDQENKKKLTLEEISNLGYEDYFKYMDTLTEEEQNKSPPLAAMVNESFPYEKETFKAEKFENLKVYAKAKIDDKAKAERDLKYWFFNEIGDTLPSSNIVWQ